MVTANLGVVTSETEGDDSSGEKAPMLGAEAAILCHHNSHHNRLGDMGNGLQMKTLAETVQKHPQQLSLIAAVTVQTLTAAANIQTLEQPVKVVVTQKIPPNSAGRSEGPQRLVSSTCSKQKPTSTMARYTVQHVVGWPSFRGSKEKLCLVQLPYWTQRSPAGAACRQ